MIQYTLKRLIGLLPVFLGITVITFFVTQLAPGDPTDLMTDLNPKISLEAKERWMEIRGLDQPVWKRYVSWMEKLVQLDFGRSFKDGQQAIDLILEKIPITLTISLASLFFIFLIAIPLGVWGAVKEGTTIDHVLTILTFAGFSIPMFWLALIMMSFFGVQLHILPVSGVRSIDFETLTPLGQVLDQAWHLALPVFVSTLTGFAGISRFMRTSMLEVLHLDYIKTARAKGLSEGAVLYKHAFRNAVLPIVTIMGLMVPGLIGGSVIFETIFSIPGMGKLMYDSILARDTNVYMAILVIGAVLTLLGNLLADIAYRFVDPRIRYD